MRDVNFTVLNRDGNSITHLFETLSHVQSMDAVDFCELTGKGPDSSVLDRSDLQEGQEISFFYVLNGRSSPKYVANVQNIDASFGADGVNYKIVLTDLGIQLKKRSHKRVWKNVRISDVVIEVAKRNGMRYDVDQTAKKHSEVQQSGMTDYDFLSMIQQWAEGGWWKFWVQNNTVFFKERKLDGQSQVTYTWGTPNSKVIAFNPSSKSTAKDPASEEVSGGSLDLDSGDQSQETITSNSTNNLGQHAIHFNRAGQQVGETVTGGDGVAESSGGFVPDDGGDVNQSNVAQAAKNEAAQKDLTANLTVKGDVTLSKGLIVTMRGVGRKYGGNWYVAEVSNKAHVAAPITQLKLQRNATDAASITEQPNDKVNDSTGPDETSSKGAYYVYTR